MNIEAERAELRQLRDELFAERPLDPLELFDDPRLRRTVVELIDRAMFGREWPH
jgi:hypothetical protein